MSYSSSILDLIGNTPVIEIPNSVLDCKATILCKLEYLNPSGSVKDRMAKYVLQTEEMRGTIKPGDTICDNTSGNAGISVAMVASAMGYKTVYTTPEKTSKEKTDLIRSFGSEVIVTPTDVAWDDPRGCFMMAKRIAEENDYYWFNQYHSQINVEGHYKLTGPEIWNQTAGKLTHFVAGIGTGGTISGIAHYLKEQNLNIKIIGVEPEGSLFKAITEKTPLPEAVAYKVEGIGTDMIVDAYHPQWVDEVIQVSDNDSFLAARYLSRSAGLSVGGSTGTNFHAIKQIAQELDESDVLLFLACDGGIRYITKLYNDDWMRENNYQLEND